MGLEALGTFARLPAAERSEGLEEAARTLLGVRSDRGAAPAVPVRARAELVACLVAYNISPDDVAAVEVTPPRQLEGGTGTPRPPRA